MWKWWLWKIHFGLLALTQPKNEHELLRTTGYSETWICRKRRIYFLIGHAHRYFSLVLTVFNTVLIDFDYG